jgi:hypothetical protein
VPHSVPQIDPQVRLVESQVSLQLAGETHLVASLQTVPDAQAQVPPHPSEQLVPSH